MQTKSRKLLSILLTLAMVLCLISAMPLTSHAMNTAELANTIVTFSVNHGGTGTFTALSDPTAKTVTVSGEVTGATSGLFLSIDSGLTVKWQARFSGSAGAMVTLTSGGTFEVVTGGSVVNTGGGSAIAALGENARITVSGGTVASGGDAISSGGKGVTIMVSGGTVNSSGAERSAIYIYGEGATVNMSGGAVTATADSGYGVCADAKSSILVRSGGMLIVSGDSGAAVYARGAQVYTEVAGGTIRSSSGSAFYMRGAKAAVTLISGTVSAGQHGVHIEGADAKVNVSGGSLKVTEGNAINDEGANTVISVSGGSLNSEHSCAIGSGGDSPVITVSGGSLHSVNFNAIGAEVKHMTLTISGGTISTASMDDKFGHAVGILAAVSDVNVKGGFLFGLGTAITGEADVIHIVSGSAPEISDPAVICAWNKPVSDGLPAYTAGTSDDLIAAPANAAVKWDKEDSRAGIKYENGANKGFFPVNGIIVNDSSVTPPPGASAMTNFLKTRTYTRGLFNDVNETLWYGFDKQKVIATAYEYRLMGGKSATAFDPAGNITIAEAIAVATRVHCLYMTGRELDFTPTSPWYLGNVNYAISNDLIHFSDFSNYNIAATRAEVAYIFSRALPVSEFTAIKTVTALPDVNNDTKYSEAIFTLYRAGILTGNDSAGTFHPDRNITRAEAAAVISRMILPSTRSGV